MKMTERAPDRVRRKRLRWLNFTLAALLGVGLGVGQGIAATGTIPNKPVASKPSKPVTGKPSKPVATQPNRPAVNQAGQPIQTKSGRKAAIKEAAQAVLRSKAVSGGAAPASLAAGIAPMAIPANPTDESVVPHYFGPFPNWANSPLTLPDVAVAILGDGAGAEASATVGAGGVVTGITITNPGSGYTVATVEITGAGTGATADVVVNLTGSVTAIDVSTGGAGYTAPVVTITANPADPVPTADATATAFGGVDAVSLVDGGSGYTNPTVDFDLPDSPDGVPAVAHAVCNGVDDGACADPGVITAIVVDQPGSGYSFAPGVAIRNGTQFDPLPLSPGGTAATVGAATLAVQTVVIDTFGSGYRSAPTVSIDDAGGTAGPLAEATATVDFGAVSAINITNPGSGYLTPGGMKKFVDTLPGLCNPSVAGSCEAATNNLGQFIPLAVPDTATFTIANGFADDADYYEIALVQYRKCLSSSFPGCDTNPPAPGAGTLLRGYVQLSRDSVTGVPLFTENLDGTTSTTQLTLPDGSLAYGVTEPQFLGPVIAATKDKPVRVTFFNLLPTGSGGDLLIPTDSTLMGSGPGPLSEEWTVPPVDEGTVMDGIRNPHCTQYPKPADCFKDSRATLHLHGGISPWISDGTPHQWITPAEDAATNLYPEGASVGQVPDMTGASKPASVPDCSGDNDGCQTFYWTNQQSARLMFYHDHAFGTTRLNVYLGEAAGYLIGDATEAKLIASATIPGPADTIPLVIQDRTFVPSDAQLFEQDPTWDASRWGGYGNFWYHHVYMPAQNPGDPSGMSAYGRWMYGPFFWPPATPPHGPIANPYYDAACNLDDPGSWTYFTDPFCEPPLIPGTPNISAGMEQFNDTPLVNGTAYPTVELQPKTYRLRVLNAANDRFMNLQLYQADPNTASADLRPLCDPALAADGCVIGGTEVALNPAELAAAQLDPVVFPTPDQTVSLPGPDWIVIGSEGGFLPAPAVVDGQQPTTWITDPTRFDVGNVDKRSLLLAPAERMDVIVDFRNYAGKTLILYNDAPAAFPARVPSYDYYTGAPDLSPVGAPAILPGYGPNTRTVMQIKVANTAPAPAFNLTKLRTAFTHKANGTGVFEEGQHPIIVGQAAYNSAYGTRFYPSGDCNFPGSTSVQCDGLARIDEQGGTKFGFNALTSTVNPTTLRPTSKLEVMIEPKGIHDEMNSAAFDEFGRMSANMGLEVVPATPALQNIVLYPYINPPTELIDGTKLPSTLDVTPIATADDGTQIWKITHNGVDTHPLHFHLYDVQLLNRVAWDNIITPNDPTEYGWKDTVRVSPLQDTIVALRPVKPELPWELPNSVRLLNPAMPQGLSLGFNNTDANGNPTTTPVLNEPVNFGWEYVWHCHILSHEEMDMMRPQSLVLPPVGPAGLTAAKTDATTVQLDWTDSSIADTQTLVQVSGDPTNPAGWITLQTFSETLGGTNYTGPRTYSDAAGTAADWNYYRVVAQNTVGYGGEFMDLTAESVAGPVQVPATPMASVTPTSLAFGTLLAGTTSAVQTVTLSNAGRAPLDIASIVPAPGVYAVPSTTCGASLAAATGPGAPTSCTIDVTFTPAVVGTVAGALTITTNDPVNPVLTVALSGTGTVPPPVAATNVVIVRQNNGTATLSWTDASTNEASFQWQSSTNGGTTWTTLGTVTRSTAASLATGDVINRNVGVSATTNALYRVLAINAGGSTPSANASLNNTVAPAAPSNVTVVSCTPDGTVARCNLAWTDNSNNNTGFRIQRATNVNFTGATTSTTSANATTWSVGNLPRGVDLYFRVQAYNNSATPTSAYVNATPFPIRTP